MKYIIASQILSNNIKTALLQEGYICVSGGRSKIIDNETAFHPDMLYFKLSKKCLLTSHSTHRVHKLDTFADVVYSNTLQGPIYPKDCLFNCFFTEKYLIAGDYIADEIKDECIKKGKTILKVRQGYAACSTIKINDNAIITSDKSIEKSLLQTKHDVLLVSNEGIELNGYNNGFIGGSAFVTEEKVMFTGNIEKHKDYETIKCFCKKYNKKLISLSNDKLYDYGGFIKLF